MSTSDTTEGHKSHFNWTSLLLGILSLFASVVALTDPGANLLAVAFLIGFAALFRGIIQISGKWTLRDIPGFNTNFLLVIGILNVILGIFLICNLWVGVIILPYLFAICFVIESFLGLLNSGFARAISNGYYWFRIILCILGIIAGVFLFFYPMSSALTLSFLVGFYFMILAITCFVEAFSPGTNDDLFD